MLEPGSSGANEMNLSICFMTGRQDHHLDWALDSLSSQVRPDDHIEVIVIDTRGRALAEPERVIVERIQATMTSGSFVVRVSLPKPNIWAGAHRVTSVDWWATSSARNTFLCLATHDFIAFLDDRSRLGPQWLEAVRQAEYRRTSVIVGTYTKIEGIAPDLPGHDQNPLRTAVDHRIQLCPDGKANCGGGWLYGCTFALPLEWALDINGFEEGCDGLTGEDYIFGLMLGNAGHRIDFVTELRVDQDRTPGNESCKGSFRCLDKGKSPNDKSHAALDRFGRARRTEFTPNLRKIRRDLVEVTISSARRGLFDEPGIVGWPVPDPEIDHRDWYDNQPIRDMV